MFVAKNIDARVRDLFFESLLSDCQELHRHPAATSFGGDGLIANRSGNRVVE
jgi:hypothetical protein